MVVYSDEKISQLIQDQLVTEGLEFFCFKFNRAGYRLLISVMIDRPEGGITLEACAHWNRKIGGLIEAKNLLREPYIVEVSSPGADWPLVSEKDFRRLTGRGVTLWVRQSPEETFEKTGDVVGVKNGFVWMKCGKDAEPNKVDMRNIVRAKARINI